MFIENYPAVLYLRLEPHFLLNNCEDFVRTARRTSSLHEGFPGRVWLETDQFPVESKLKKSQISH